MEERQILITEESQIVFVALPPFRRWSCVPECHLPAPLMWLDLDLLSKTRVWKGKNNDFAVEEPGKHYFIHMTNLTSLVRRHVDAMDPDMMQPEGPFISEAFFPQSHNLSLLLRKQSKCKLRDILQNT